MRSWFCRASLLEARSPCFYPSFFLFFFVGFSFKLCRLQRFSTLVLWYHVEIACGGKYGNRTTEKEHRFNGELRLTWYTGERERERERRHNNFIQNNTQSILCSVHRVCSMTLLYKSFLDWQKYWQYFNAHERAPTFTPKYIPYGISILTASRFLHRTGLPTHRYAYWFTYPASPIGPNRSGPRLSQLMRPMLSLSLNKNQALSFGMVRTATRVGVAFELSPLVALIAGIVCIPLHYRTASLRVVDHQYLLRHIFRVVASPT